jgi:thioredoxin-like negative regulator of GroEL
MSIPTLLMLSDGHVVDRIVGALPEEALRGRVDAVLGGGAA